MVPGVLAAARRGSAGRRKLGLTCKPQCAQRRRRSVSNRVDAAPSIAGPVVIRRVKLLATVLVAIAQRFCAREELPSQVAIAIVFLVLLLMLLLLLLLPLLLWAPDGAGDIADAAALGSAEAWRDHRVACALVRSIGRW